jgi:hypothetical protein
MKTSDKSPPSLEQLEHYAEYAGQCSSDLLHEMSEWSFVLQKRLRSCEKAMDRELRRRNKELMALAYE